MQLVERVVERVLLLIKQPQLPELLVQVRRRRGEAAHRGVLRGEPRTRRRVPTLEEAVRPLLAVEVALERHQLRMQLSHLAAQRLGRHLLARRALPKVAQHLRHTQHGGLSTERLRII